MYLYIHILKNVSLDGTLFNIIETKPNLTVPFMVSNLSKHFIGYLRDIYYTIHTNSFHLKPKFSPSTNEETPQTTLCHCKSTLSPKNIRQIHDYFFLFLFLLYKVMNIVKEYFK